jgi:methionine biosynthesis protein MetW
MIPAGKRVLEIGCATGNLSEYLIQEKNCSVTAVEADAAQAAVARERGLTVIHGYADHPRIQDEIDDYVRLHTPFDVVFMSQVIEHIADPWAMLVKIRDWIGRDGVLVVSTCNIAHWKCRFRLLAGKWEYEEYGIMDRDHLRFFTLHSFARLLEECGYQIQESGFSFQDFCPVKLLFNFRLLAPSDLLRLVPLVGGRLRSAYTQAARHAIATQFVYRAGVRL